MREAVSVCVSALILCLGYSATALAAEEAQPKVITNSIGMKLVLIPAGEFMMGSAESPEEVAKAFKEYGEPLSLDFEEEHPRHRVRITQAFYLGIHEVTVSEFRQFVQTTGYKTDAEKDGKGGAGIDPETGNVETRPEHTWRNPGFPQTDDRPVVNVSWNDAAAYCAWLSRKERKTYRLPTEAEWEYACRAGTTSRYSNGNFPETLADVGNVADAALKTEMPELTFGGKWQRKVVWAISASDGYALSAPVGQLRPNAFGLYDMHGNVWEWCADWYEHWFADHYFPDSPAEDPTGPTCGEYRILRGGSWYNGPFDARSAFRLWSTPDNRYFSLGFRVARTP